MRVFLSSQQALQRHSIPAYAFWEFYFKQGLAEAGHEVLAAPNVDWAEGLTQMEPVAHARWLSNTWTRTVDFLRSEHARRGVDLFLSYLFPNQVEPAAVASIRRLGIPCVNFFCDNIREFYRIPASYHGFDLHWVPEADARSLYAAAKLPFIYAPMPMWVPPELRILPEKENDDITFIGSHDALRENLLGESVAHGLPLRLHGDGWQSSNSVTATPPRTLGGTFANQFAFLRAHGLRGFAMRTTYQFHRPRPREWIDRCWQPAVYGEAYFRATRESQVVIGINRYPSFRHSFLQPGRYSRLRDIEAPMLGACYLVEWAPGLDDLYDLDTEIATYRDAMELVAQASFLRANPAKRQSLRRLGQRRALSAHTLARSVQRIADTLGCNR
jgi:Glycosyl transferases group 1